MANIHGIPGEWARVKGTVLGLWPIFIGVGACGFSFAILVCGKPALGLTLLALSFVGILFAVMKGLRHVERFFKGARGEERVALILRDLPDTYHVFNDFLACGNHIDHVVIGPAGVFAIETKNWRGRVTIEEKHILVDGRLPSREPLAQVLREARLVKAQLDKAGWKADVTPVLAFASDTFDSHIAELNGAVVINACDLAKSFETNRIEIQASELDRLVSLMEHVN